MPDPRPGRCPEPKPAGVGLETRAATLMAQASPEVSEDISGALMRLTGGGPGGMGSMFKVLGVSGPALEELPGLSNDNQPDGDA